MRAAILCIAVLLLPSARVGYASSRAETAWEYLALGKNAEQWAVISVDGNPGYFQCARYDDHLRCPFPVWAWSLPGAGVYMPVSGQDRPHPVIEGSAPTSYMAANQVETLTRILSRKGLEFSNVYSLLEDQSGATVGTNYDVVLILELDYGNFEGLVAEVLETVWGADITQPYRVDTDRD